MSTTIGPESVRRYIEGLNALDPDLALSGYAAGAVIRYPGQPPMDVSGFHAYLTQVETVLERLELNPLEVFETNHGVAAHWSFTATTRGGQTATCSGIDSWVIGPDGAIQSVDIVYDPSPLAQALES
jgi:hypothetical protein